LRDGFFGSFFFFQAEDGIRDRTVTGVQTCALPISTNMAGRGTDILLGGNPEYMAAQKNKEVTDLAERARIETEIQAQWQLEHERSEERRVGKECRAGWTAEH